MYLALHSSSCTAS